MGIREKLTAGRVEEVEVDGVTFRLHRPDIEDMLLRLHSDPALRRVQLELEAAGLKDTPEGARRLFEAKREDFESFAYACICDATRCEINKLVLSKADADADATGNSVWIQELVRGEVMDRFVPPICKLLGITFAQLEALSPFRKPSDAIPAGAELGDEAGAVDPPGGAQAEGAAAGAEGKPLILGLGAVREELPDGSQDAGDTE